MATTKVVTGHTIDAIRINDDQSITVVVTVTYSDATTDVIEFFATRLIP